MANYPKFLQPPEAYGNMVSSIVAKDAKYQYFEGMAFTTTWAKIQNKIKAEARQEYKIWQEEQIKYGKKDLVVKLTSKKEKYQGVEQDLWYALVKELSRTEGYGDNISQLKNFPGQYPVGGAAKDKIRFWDWLMFYRVLTRANGRGGFSTLDSQSQTYCVIRSKEMYNYLRNVPQIKTRLSRKDWEKGLGRRKSFYDLDDDKKMAILEKEMQDALMKRKDSKGSIDALTTLAIKELEKEIQDKFLESFSADEYITLASEGLGKVKKKIKGMKGAGYREMHDLLKEWLISFGEEVNKGIRTQILQLNPEAKAELEKYPIKINIKNGNSVFFTLEAQGGNEESVIDELATSFEENMLNFFRNFPHDYLHVEIAGKTRNFRISKEAKKQIANLPIKGVINAKIIKTYLNTNGNSLKSNSVIAGVLGELGSYYHLNTLGIEAASTGSMQQMYNSAGNMVLAESAAKGKETYGNDYKSAGQSFSDMMFQVNAGRRGMLNVGFNIKNYITNEKHFTLMSAQVRGMNLNSTIIKRYLSQQEINLLKFVQANNALLSKYAGSFRNFPDLEKIATTIMDNNVDKLLRLEGQGSDTINYLIVANGHYIPASCIFGYALDKIKEDEGRMNNIFYSLENTSLFPYETRRYDGTTITDSETGMQVASVNPLDAETLQIDSLVSRYQSLVYQLKKFEVSVSQLLL